MEPIVAFPFRHHTTLVCQEAKNLLLENGFHLVCNDTGRILSRDEQKEIISQAYGIIAGTETYDADMLASAKNLKVLIRFGVGLDNFDMAKLKEMGVKVGTISNANAVAEFALTLMLSCLRNIPAFNNEIRKGRWCRLPQREISGKTIGLLGFGRIGQRLAKLMSGFDVQLIAYDPFINIQKAEELNVKPVSLNYLLRNSDIISLHLPLTPETHHIINADSLDKMKDGSCIINTARGSLIDENVLTRYLQIGKIACAGLDVYEKEPISADSPLLLYNNLVLTPHVAALTKETNFNAGMTSAQSIINVYNGLEPIFPAN